MPTYKRIAVDKIKVDERYQRPLDPAWVKSLVAKWDEAMVGTLEVSQRNGGGSFTVFDGQHRLAAAKVLGIASLPSLIHKGLTAEEEAELFVGLQRQRRSIGPVDRFRARLFLGEDLAITINETVEECGYHISNGGEDMGRLNAIKAITSLERVHKRGNLHETLTMLQSLWGGDNKSTDGGLIEGLSLVLHGYGHRLNGATFERLREAAPVLILRRAIGNAGGGSSKGVMIAGEIKRAAKLKGPPRQQKEPGQ